jgi:hypothetical protein
MKIAKTIGDTSYSFPSLKLASGKRPQLCPPAEYPRKTKDILVRTLRDWQKKAYKSLRDSRLFLVKAFCGSGKTTLSVVLGLYDLIKNKRKQLYIVPQSHIGDGFCVSGEFYIPQLGVVHLGKSLNFCEDSDSKTDMLINFLMSNVNYSRSVTDLGKNQYVVNGASCMAVATHQCFVAAMDRIIERESKGEKGLFDKCVKNLSLYIDEAHHIKTGDSEQDKLEEETHNRLGRISDNIIKNADENNSRVGLTTATFFRGDQGIIIDPQNIAKFHRFELDFLEHFETLGIEKVFVNFEEYEVDPIKQIVANIESELNERHLIVVPTGGKIGSKWRKNDIDLSRLKKEISLMLKRNGLDSNEVVLDLVDQETQKHNKSILLKEPKEAYSEDETKNSKIRIVITCMLGREGTDWCPCSRLHNASIELGSTTLAVQTLGRLFRKFYKKNSVGVTYYIKNFDSLETAEKKREFISNRVNAMLALMIIDDLMNPIMLPELPTTPHAGAKRIYKKKKKTKKIRLNQVYSSEDFEKIKEEILKSVSYQFDFDSYSVEEIIENSISKYEKKAAVDSGDIVAAFKVFLLRAKSEALRSKGIDISFVRLHGFDEIVEENKLEGNFWAGVLTGKKLEKFKELIGKIFWTRQQNDQIKNNIRSVLSKQIGQPIIDSKKSHEEIIRKMVRVFCDFHDAYNKTANKEKSKLPTRQGVAEQLKVSTVVLNQRVDLLNRIVPKGYEFFYKSSKITDKIAPAA